MATIKGRKASLSHGLPRNIDAGVSWDRCNLANVFPWIVKLFFSSQGRIAVAFAAALWRTRQTKPCLF